MSFLALYRWGILLLVAVLAASSRLFIEPVNPPAAILASAPTAASQPEATRVSLAGPQAPTTTPPPLQNFPLDPTGNTDWQPAFPIRAAFYYPWFPEAWKQNGFYPYTNYTPSLGLYSSQDETIIKKHIDMMLYGHIDAGIASWWGPGSHTDETIAGLISAASGTHFRWGLYYENESQGDPSVDQIRSDLTYIRDHYGQDPSFLRVNGKFVVFVYTKGSDRCSMAERWKQANTIGAYISLKIFPGYQNCASQPDSWHQYAPATSSIQVGDLSYVISPGFWSKGGPVRLERNLDRWSKNVSEMVASNARWQLIATFSEWGEGTAVEPAVQWDSSSGYGLYLDVLHSYGGEGPP